MNTATPRRPPGDPPESPLSEDPPGYPPQTPWRLPRRPPGDPPETPCRPPATCRICRMRASLISASPPLRMASITGAGLDACAHQSQATLHKCHPSVALALLN
eukprot:1192259-Prorocentrum_minimum.AAC.3